VRERGKKKNTTFLFIYLFICGCLVSDLVTNGDFFPFLYNRIEHHIFIFLSFSPLFFLFSSQSILTKMGIVYNTYLDEYNDVYACLKCSTHLSATDMIISKVKRIKRTFFFIYKNSFYFFIELPWLTW
jgi:hypothetical protein